MWQSRSTVLTSARRWRRDGWVRRSAGNIGLATRFLLGAPPARLAREYFGRHAGAVVTMARAPWTGGKTRLDTSGGAAAHEDLRHALFLDTLDVVTSMTGVEHIVACEPPDACEAMRALAGATVDVIAQRGGDLGQRLACVFEDVFRVGVNTAVVIGSDLPDLPPRLLEAALASLDEDDDRVVLGPSPDGGYYLVGMNRPHPDLFEGIDWSTDRVLTQTLDAARAHGIDVVLIEPWADVDEPRDLTQLAERTAGSAASRTRAWCSAHSAGGAP
jgi:hypothetical protein